LRKSNAGNFFGTPLVYPSTETHNPPESKQASHQACLIRFGLSLLVPEEGWH